MYDEVGNIKKSFKALRQLILGIYLLKIWFASKRNIIVFLGLINTNFLLVSAHL